MVDISLCVLSQFQVVFRQSPAVGSSCIAVSGQTAALKPSGVPLTPAEVIQSHEDAAALSEHISEYVLPELDRTLVVRIFHTIIPHGLTFDPETKS